MPLRGVGSNHIMGGQSVNNKFTTENYVVFYTFAPYQNWMCNCPPSSYAPAALTTQQVSDVNSQQGVKP